MAGEDVCLAGDNGCSAPLHDNGWRLATTAGDNDWRQRLAKIAAPAWPWAWKSTPVKPPRFLALQTVGSLQGAVSFIATAFYYE